MVLKGTVTKETIPDPEAIAAEEDFAAELPKLGLTDQDRIVSLLDFLWTEMQAREGRAPNFFVHEFELATGVRVTKSSDFNPDRWIIYFRSEANAIVRAFPGGSVPAVGAPEISDGRYMVIANTQNLMSFHNIGASTAHIFAVAIGGGAEFQIGSIS